MRSLEQGEGRGLVFKALYHSHPEHDAYFSAEDKALRDALRRAHPTPTLPRSSFRS